MKRNNYIRAHCSNSALHGGCTKKKADNTVEVFCLNMDVTSSVPESYVLRSKNSGCGQAGG